MKKILLILLTLAIPALLLAEEPVRKWTSTNGYSTQATYDASRDTDPASVPLIKEDGKRIGVPFNRLSKADQDYVTRVRQGRRSLSGGERNGEPRAMQVIPESRRYALLIGVNEYAKPIKSLQFCVNDMNLLAESFEAIGVPKENIILVTDESPAERRPTGENIRQQIEIVIQLMEQNDQLIIAFSGHGAMVDGKPYLCPSDTNLDNKNSIISLDWAFAQLEKCKAKQKIFIIDACRDEVSFGDQRALGETRTLEDPIGADTHGFILISSCDRNQKSWEHSDLKHGVFTYFLAEGLAGAAKDEDGYVSILNLFQYASSKTKKYVYHEFNKAQVPTLRQGDEITDFYIAKLESAPPAPTTHSPGPVLRAPTHSPIPNRRSFKAGERIAYTVNGVEFAFHWCPPGKFMMGSPKSERMRQDNEEQHQVTLTKGFWMMETEVTQKQWSAVMGNSPSHFDGEDYPVESVSWDDCQEFCKKCAQMGMPVQLPTEAQWEYACRAGTTGAYAGNLDDFGWYGRNTRGVRNYSAMFDDPWNGNKGIGQIQPVGMKKANAWGLYDMHGNVCEWCEDRYGVYPMRSQTDPTGPSSGAERVTRGGSWDDYGLLFCRSASRIGSDPDRRDYRLGFRCVISE